MEFKKGDLLIEDKSEEGIIKKVISKLKDVRNRAQSEIKETRALVRILTHAVKSYAKNREFDLNEEDKKFIKGQSTDVVRGLILTIVAMIPLPIPLTPFLIIFGKKIGIDLVPKEQEIPHKGKSKKDKIDESKFNKFVSLLNEQIEQEEKNNLIYRLCDQAIKRKLKTSPFCKLKEYYENSPAKEKTLEALEVIYDFLVIDNTGVNQGVFPKIVRSALISTDATQTLYIISYFIKIEKQKIEDNKNNPKTERDLERQKLFDKLKRYKGRKFAPINVDEFLRQLSSVGFSEYEESLTKDELKQYRTSLFLDYNCADDINQTLLKLLAIIRKEKPENKYDRFNDIFSKVTACLESFMSTTDSAIKADAVYELDYPLMYDGVPVIKTGDYIEIKKMDPEVDSYLSEFFSVFKQSKNKSKKRDFLILYNFFVDMLFEWILKNGNVYKQKVIDNMSGIIYDNHIFVPKEQIELYWSNMGQRGCDERRLSLRFRLKPGLKTMVGYIYEPGKGEDSITRTEVRNLPAEFKERFVCRETHFNILDFGQEYMSKQDYEKQNVTENKRINIVITEAQYRQLTEENFREFLYSFWDNQKKQGEDPSLDDIIFQISEIRKDSREDYQTIRPIWYEYNGGYEKILQDVRDKIEHAEFHFKGGANLDMVIFVDEVYSYGLNEQGGMVDIICRVVGGTIDGYVYNEDTEMMDEVPNMDIFEQYSLLDYESGDLVQFLTDETYQFFSNLLKDRLIPIHVDLMVK